MREMDPSKHMPFNDKNTAKDKRKSGRSQRLTLVMLLSIIYMLGLIYYRDFYNKGVEVNGEDYGVVQPEDNLPIVNNAQKFEEAKTLIEEGMAKWDDLEYVEYSVRGSDGDETAYMEYHYKLDLINDEYDLTSYNPCPGGEDPMPCMQENRYVSKNGKIINNVNGKNETIDDFDMPFTLQEVDEMILPYLDKNLQSGYEMDVKVVDGVYGLDNQSVKFVSINYFRQPSGNAFTSIFKAYADVILDKYSIELVLDAEGNILEVKVPYVYDEIHVIFSSYNETLEINLPEEE